MSTMKCNSNRITSLSKVASLLCLMLLLVSLIHCLPNADASQSSKSKSPNAKGNTQFINHVVKDIEGWQVHVDEALLSKENEQLGKTAIKVLANKLYRISLVLPAEQVSAMRKVRIFMDHQHKLSSMQYHPGAGWLKSHGYDVQMTKAVHIPKVVHLIRLEKTQAQPWVMLHELSHAYHDQVLSFNNKEIIAAFEHAREEGILKRVMHMRGHNTRHYALSNHKEYFAEMTESYVGTNDFYPFVRPELKKFHPKTYTLMQKIWGKRR